MKQAHASRLTPGSPTWWALPSLPGVPQGPCADLSLQEGLVKALKPFSQRTETRSSRRGSVVNQSD